MESEVKGTVDTGFRCPAILGCSVKTERTKGDF